MSSGGRMGNKDIGVEKIVGDDENLKWILKIERWLIEEIKIKRDESG